MGRRFSFRGLPGVYREAGAAGRRSRRCHTTCHAPIPPPTPPPTPLSPPQVNIFRGLPPPTTGPGGEEVQASAHCPLAANLAS